MRNEIPDSLATIPAAGWRGSPWLSRLAAVALAIIITAMAFSILGAPTSLIDGLWFGLSYLIVLVFWLPFELMSEREITITPSGIWLHFPVGKHFVVWNRLEVSRRERHPWMNAVGIVEKKDGPMKRRAYIVTRDQAQAILHWMAKVP